MTLQPGQHPATVTAWPDADHRLNLATLLTAASARVDALQFQVSPVTPTTPASYRLFAAAMLDPARRGIPCRLIVAHATPRTPQAAANEAAAEALRASGWLVRWSPGSRLLHAKSWLIDDRYAVIGSHNTTEAALTMNRELSVCVDAAGFALALRARFEALWIGATETPGAGRA